jgi:spore coat polysaccharide biosynthesis protein SpsF
MANIGAIIQARCSSTRLPGKVLHKLPFGGNVTVLEQVIRRLKKSERVNNVIVATTTEECDYSIIEIAEKEKVKWFRGSQDDVLERHYLAARENNLDIIVRVTSDCPCVDAQIVDLIIKQHIEKKGDYTSNCIIKTYPWGLDAEVFSFNALDKAYKQAKKNFEREHVTPYIKENSDIFKVVNVKVKNRLYAPDIRVTLDTKEDYVLLCSVFDYLYPKNNYFTAVDIVKLFKEKPWLKFINDKVVHKKI